MKEACSLLLLLGLAWMTEWTAADPATFKREVVDYTAPFTIYSPDYCNKIMKERELNHKASHVFIHAPMEKIKAICTDEGGLGTPDGKRWSNHYFHITACQAYGPSANGVYSDYNTFTTYAIIAIACENGEPSRYVGIIRFGK